LDWLNWLKNKSIRIQTNKTNPTNSTNLTSF
jgi:hypothetical protein